MFTVKDWIGLAVSSLFAYAVFGKISSRAGYPRWHGLLMAVPIVNLIALITSHSPLGPSRRNCWNVNCVVLRARSSIWF